MTVEFEDHCWKDIVTPEILKTYTPYHRETYIGQRPALLAIDLYNLAYEGGAKVSARARRYLQKLLRHLCAQRDQTDARTFCVGALAEDPGLLHDHGNQKRSQTRTTSTPPTANGSRSIRKRSKSKKSSSPNRATWSFSKNAPAAFSARRWSLI